MYTNELSSAAFVCNHSPNFNASSALASELTITPRQSPFPIYCLPAVSQGSAWELINNVGIPPEMPATTLLSCMAASVQGSFDVEPVPGMRVPLSLMTLVVAPSGSGKTVVENRLTAGIKKFEGEMREKYDRDWIQYQSAMDAHAAERKAILGLLKEQTKAGKDTEYVRQQLSELDSNAPPVPKLAKIISKNTTLAGIEDSASLNWPNIFVSQDEASDFLETRFDGLISIANSTWSASPITVDTSKRKLFVKEPRITWHLQVQPKAFERFLRKAGIRILDEGLLARTQLAYVEPSQYQPGTLVNQQWAATDTFNELCYEHLLASVSETGKPVAKKVLKLDIQAHTLLDQERQRINSMKSPGGPLYYQQELCAKASDTIIRISAILHVFNNGVGDIPAQCVMNAIEIFAWFANEQIRVFTPAPKPPQEWCDANLLLRWFANFVRTHNQLCIQKNHLLKQGPRATRSSARLNAALLLLWQQGILQEHVPEGSKATFILLHPNAFQPYQIAQLLNQNLAFPS